jgi:hypothetical protein
MLVLHLRSLGENTLAGQIYREQLAADWPGLAKEAENICNELGIESCNTTQLYKKEYRAVVTTACRRLELFP